MCHSFAIGFTGLLLRTSGNQIYASIISAVRLAALILAGSTLIAGCGSDTTALDAPDA